MTPVKPPVKPYKIVYVRPGHWVVSVPAVLNMGVGFVHCNRLGWEAFISAPCHDSGLGMRDTPREAAQPVYDEWGRRTA
jgi:hypothetical protein